MSKYWKIPPDGDAAFVAAMEDVLTVYQLPHDPRFPVVCMDESNKQLVGEVQAAIPVAPGHGCILDHEYVRNGVATLFVDIEPLAGRRHVEVTERRPPRIGPGSSRPCSMSAIRRRSRCDWCWKTSTPTRSHPSMKPSRQPKRAVWPSVSKSTPPKHCSWLNIAEIELSALNSQCLHRRIPSLPQMQSEIAAWQSDRNHRGAPVNWRFTTDDARVKPTRLYPRF